MKLCEASRMLILRDSPTCVLSSPVVLFGWWGTGCEIYTSRVKRGQVETQRWTWWLTPWSCHQRREINGERKTSKGKLTIFLKSRTEVSNYIHSETCNLHWDTQPHTDTHSFLRTYTHTHTPLQRPNLCWPCSPLQARTKLDGEGENNVPRLCCCERPVISHLHWH